MEESSRSSNTLTPMQLKRLTSLEVQIRAHYARHIPAVLANRVSLAYHPGCNNHPEHIVIRSGNNTRLSLRDMAEKRNADTLPAKVLEEMTVALGESCRKGKKDDYIAIDGRFEDAAETLEAAIQEIEGFYKTQQAESSHRQGGGKPPRGGAGGRY